VHDKDLEANTITNRNKFLRLLVSYDFLSKCFRRLTNIINVIIEIDDDMRTWFCMEQSIKCAWLSSQKPHFCNGYSLSVTTDLFSLLELIIFYSAYPSLFHSSTDAFIYLLTNIDTTLYKISSVIINLQ
jgi:hypothetical protein